MTSRPPDTDPGAACAPDDPPRQNHPRDGQLLLELPVRTAFDRAAFCVSECNRAAMTLIEAWPGWSAPWCLLVGPAGSGKTHLAHIWAQRTGAAVMAQEGLTVEAVPDLLKPGALALELGDGPVSEEAALFHLINLAREQGAALLLTARSHPAAWSFERADLKSRLRAMPSTELAAPDDAVLAELLAKLFRDRQITVAPGVIDYLTVRMERSFLTAQALVAWLDRTALVRKKPITTRLAMEILTRFEETHEQVSKPGT